MTHFKYLIIGAGMTADAAVRGIRELDPKGSIALIGDDRRVSYTYERLLLATGGTPRKLPFSGENIIYFRTLEDYRRLQEMCGQSEHLGVIGGGFIGSEIAAALTMNGKKVTMLFPE